MGKIIDLNDKPDPVAGDLDQLRKKVEAEAQAKANQEAETRRIQDQAAGILPLGVGIRFSLRGLKPLPINRRNKIAKIREHRTIVKDEKAERYIKAVRTYLYGVYKDLCKQDAHVKALTFPINGKETPLRADVFFAYAKQDKGHGELKRADLDNLAKGILDAMKVGPTEFPGVEWGVISDDNYITELVLVKGDAPDDGQGSGIIINITRAGWRSADDMTALVDYLRPWPPWTPGWGSRILIPKGANPISPSGRI